MKEKQMITCKHCKAEIAPSAKICPHCGGKVKMHVYKKWWFWLIIVIVVIVATSRGGDSEQNMDTQVGVSESKTENGKKTKPKSEKPKITYKACNVSELVDDLEDNAMKAADKYKGQYVKLTGRLSNIDSSGKYIDLEPINDDFVFTSVQCYMKSDKQRAAIMEMSKGDTLIVKGKITSVGEILGYSLDIDEVKKVKN